MGNFGSKDKKDSSTTELTTEQKAMLAEIDAMQGPEGFDVIIVCCSNLAAERFWQARLSETAAEVTGCASTTVLAVHEDWNGGGAGNGLGTLYAFQKACAKAAEAGHGDLLAKLKGGAAVAIYHTAGKGTRMAPLPGAENNNKPGVKLSALVKVGGEQRPLTILEAVVRQTSSYARVRKGRCSVFWGDQEEWEAEGLHQYGLIAVAADGSATQLEKVTYDVAVRYLPKNVKQVGTSLGSFSLSAAFMSSLLDEFAPELVAKTACLDSDPHFWMPVTLGRQDYLDVMSKKGTTEDEAGAHFDRMAAFRAKFAPGGEALLGCVDVGQTAYWQQLSEIAAAAEVDAGAVILNSKVGGGRIGPNSVLVNVNAPSVDVEGCVLINVTSTRPIKGRGGLLYNVVDEAGGLEPLTCDAVRADVFMPGGIKHVMHSSLATDGGTAWKVTLDGNPHSFEGIYKANQPLDVQECTAAADAAHKQAKAKL